MTSGCTPDHKYKKGLCAWEMSVVGGKIVHYPAHLYSAALGPITIYQSLLYFLIIFGPKNPWELRVIYNPGQNPETRETQYSLPLQMMVNLHC